MSSFHPPFCPNPRCRHHRKPVGSRWFVRNGSYRSAAFGSVPRFRCSSCGRGFSSQTFSIDYYAKRIINYRTLFQHLISASGTRDLQRFLKCSTSSVQNRCMRLARNCLAIHSCISSTRPITPNIATDGLQSFCLSQYFPNYINILVDSESQFLHEMNFSILRRGGRMTDEQKRRRAEFESKWKADPKAVQWSMEGLFSHLDRRCMKEEVIHIDCDEHQGYTRAIRTVWGSGSSRITVRCTSSRKRRDHRNPLFPVNYLDRQIRKDLSDHVRETVQWAKNSNDMMARLAIYQVFHNYIKPYRIRREAGDRRTHGTVYGFDGRMIARELKGLFTDRAFRTRLELSGDQTRTWLRLWVNPLGYGCWRIARHCS